MTMCLGGHREGVGLQINKIGLFRTFCICPDPSKVETTKECFAHQDL